MSAELRSLARSVFCVGYDGSEAAAVPVAELQAFGPGAIVLFARNVGSGAALRASIARLRTCGSPPPLIAIDQEGGRVARIGDPAVCVQLPSPMALAAGDDGEQCERLARRLGGDLARLGISVNFAPCADLAREPRNTVIGTRSFGEDPARAASLSVAFARGLETGGVAAAIKHFPGHGSTECDSHAQLARISTPGSTFRQRDLVPFAAAISARVSIVMTAHLIVEAFDPLVPATLSAPVLTGLLREELGFTGVIATDCLEMDAIAATVGTSAGAVEALRAGADLLLVSHRLDRAEAAADAIVAAIGAGSLARERLELAAQRVGFLRERFAKLEPSPPDGADGSERIAAQRAVTIVRGDPVLRPGRAVTVISFEGTIADGAAGTRMQYASLSAALRARRFKSELMRVALEPDADDIALLLAHIAALGDRNFIVVMRRAHLYAAQAAAIGRILAAVPHAILVSAREPYDAALFKHAATICIYGDEELAFAGCADVLTGVAAAAGRLPVSIDRVAGIR